MPIRLLRNLSLYKENEVVTGKYLFGRMTIETPKGTCWLNSDEYELMEFFILGD